MIAARMRSVAVRRFAPVAALAVGMTLTAGAAFAETRTFQLTSPVPFPIQVRILGSAPQFPQVLMVPTPPHSIPVAYPDINMQLQIRMPNGHWSPTQTLPWRQGTTPLPKLF